MTGPTPEPTPDVEPEPEPTPDAHELERRKRREARYWARLANQGAISGRPRSK
jgi:hypothetical protein